MLATLRGVHGEAGDKLADVEHDEAAGLFYVSSDMSDPAAFAGCAESLDEAVAQWACAWPLGDPAQPSLF